MTVQQQREELARLAAQVFPGVVAAGGGEPDNAVKLAIEVAQKIQKAANEALQEPSQEQADARRNPDPLPIGKLHVG